MSVVNKIYSSKANYFLFSLTTLALIYLLVIFNFNDRNVSFSEDLALSLSVSKLYFNSQPAWLGPPSHIGGRHLGPIYYLYTAASLYLGDFDTLKTIQACSLIKLISILAFIFLTIKLNFFKNKQVALFFMLVSLIAGQFTYIIRDAWHSNFLIVPAAFMFLSSFYVIKNGYRFFPLFILLASITVQTHYASAPAAVGLFLFHVVDLLRKQNHKELKDLFTVRAFIFYLLTLLSFLPAIFFEIYYPGNIKALLASKQFETKTFSSYQAVYRIIVFFINSLFYKSILVHTKARVVFTALVGITILAFSFLDKKTNLQKYLLACICATCPYILALHKVPVSANYSYVLNTLMPLALVLIGIFSSTVYESIKKNNPTKTCIVLLLLLSLFCLSTSSAIRNIKNLGNNFVYRYHNLAHAKEIASLIENEKGEEQDIKILAGSATIPMIDSYYYLLDGNYQHFMRFKESFKEIAAFTENAKKLNRKKRRKRPQAKLAFLVACPRVSKATKDHIFSNFKKNKWVNAGVIPIGDCTSCSQCLLNKFISSTK